MNGHKKEGFSVRFSYLDLIILLFAGLIISLGIYLGGEREETMSLSSCRVQATAVYREELAHAVPKAGDVLLDEKGTRIGMVMQTAPYEEEGEDVYLLSLEMEGVSVREGDEIPIHTADSIVWAVVWNVTTEGGEDL